MTTDQTIDPGALRVATRLRVAPSRLGELEFVRVIDGAPFLRTTSLDLGACTLQAAISTEDVAGVMFWRAPAVPPAELTNRCRTPCTH